MAVCSFIGNSSVYDTNFYPRLRTALNDLIEGQDHTEFLFAQVWDSFSRCCLKAVLELKGRYPDKVRLSLVLTEEIKQEYPFEDWGKDAPAYIADYIHKLRVPTKAGADVGYELRYLHRYMLQISTHVVCYLYERLYERCNRLLAYARKQPQLTIVDISAPETAQKIDILASTQLLEREQFLVEKLSAGYLFKEIAPMLGVSEARTRQIGARAGRRLRKMIRLHIPADIYGGERPELTCAVFSLDAPYAEKWEVFKSVISLLIRGYQVKVFNVLAKYYQSSYGGQLLNTRHSYGLKINAVYPYSDSRTDEFQVIASMMDQADFCVCDLSVSPFGREIIKYAARASWICLMDIGAHPQVLDCK